VNQRPRRELATLNLRDRSSAPKYLHGLVCADPCTRMRSVTAAQNAPYAILRELIAMRSASRFVRPPGRRTHLGERRG
jgi:hypothetical protein